MALETGGSDRAGPPGSLNHPNLVTIYDVGTHEGAPYIVMELQEGERIATIPRENILGALTK